MIADVNKSVPETLTGGGGLRGGWPQNATVQQCKMQDARCKMRDAGSREDGAGAEVSVEMTVNPWKINVSAREARRFSGVRVSPFAKITENP